MHCPHCGTEASTEQKFCRSCGMNLLALFQIVTDRPATTQADQTAMELIERFRGRRSRMLRWGFVTMWAGLVLAATLGGLGGALSTVDWRLGSVVASLASIGGVTLLVGIGLMIYSLFLPRMPTPSSTAQQQALPQASQAATSSPEGLFGTIPSVTEHTTKSLYARPHEPVRSTRPDT